MNLHETVRAPASAIWALGLTQNIGYGTLFYAFPVLAPAISRDLGLPEQWVFGAFSVSLFLASLLAPTAGRLADRFGAARIMTAGSLAAALALAGSALAPGTISFAAALVAMQLASCFVLYATAFVAIVQAAPARAQRSITHLTLIAGFASSIFWPLTTALHAHLSWREVHLAFAALNLFLCLPVHAWLAQQTRKRLPASEPATKGQVPTTGDGAVAGRDFRRAAFFLMLAGFAVEGFVLAAVLTHMVPLVQALGLGATGIAIAALYGPSQVASRLINMLFGDTLRQTVLAVISTLLLLAGLGVLIAAGPSLLTAGIFVVLFGFGGGLLSIVGGTLPLEVFGRAGYGGHVGWMSAARQFSSSFGPFVLALAFAQFSVQMSIGMLMIACAIGAAMFGAIAILQTRSGTALVLS